MVAEFFRMNRLSKAAGFLALVALAGCTEVRGRKTVQEANELYKQGDYRGAVAKFQEAEQLIPSFPTLWLNKGFTCKQLIIPGSRSKESVDAGECALEAFRRFRQLKPSDPRGEQLYVQTLFDAGHFEELEKMYVARYQSKPCDKESIGTLQQVYGRWDKFEEGLEWYKKAAECEPNVAERHYSVGVFIWQRLFTHGGAAEMASYDPRPYAAEIERYKGKKNPPTPVAPPPPVQGVGAIVSQQRIDLADMGIAALEKAVEIHPKYQEAMTYINLLYRQKSFAYFDDIPKWQEAVDKATEWMKKSLELLHAANGGADGGAGHADGGAASEQAAADTDGGAKAGATAAIQPDGGAR